jgi:hypothetical protein
MNQPLLQVGRLVALSQELHPCEDEERAEDIDEPVEAREHRAAREDHDGAHDQRPQDAPEQHAVLVERRHLERREDDDEHEDVVDAQRLFDEVARQELGPELRPELPPDDRVEHEGEGDPDRAPRCGLLEAHDVGLLVEDAEVEGQHGEHEG